MRRYSKPQSVKDLEERVLAAKKIKLPLFPYHTKPKFRDDTANGLTKCIIEFIRLEGWQAERISVTGRILDNRKVVTDVIGRTQIIGSTQWIKTSGVKGTADISATIRGMSVKIEVKIKDKQSEDQKRYQASVEKAGGIYIICRSLDEFIKWYKKTTTGR